MENANPTAPYETDGFIDYVGYDRYQRNLDFYQTEDNRAASGENAMVTELDLAVFTLNYESDLYSLVSISSWSDAIYDQQANTDGSPLRLLEIDWHTDTTAFSQDFRFVSNFDGPFEIIAGLYYGREDTYMNNVYYLYEDLVDYRVPLAKPDTAGQAPFVLDFGALDQRQETEKETTALYSQMRWDFTANFGMDIGLRYTQDKTSMPYINVSRIDYDGSGRGTYIPGNDSGYDSAFVPVPLPSSVLSDPASILGFLADPSPFINQLGNGAPGYTHGPYTLDSGAALEATEREWTGKLGVDYRFNDQWMGYASYSKGYRAGSFNGGIYYEERPLSSAYASPEYIDAYELGFKADLLDNTLRINTAAFFYDYTDQQFINVVGISNFLENAGGSKITGFETEIWWAASDKLVLNLGLGVLESEYTELTLRNTETIADTDDTIDLAGNELISAPKINASLSVDYEIINTQYGYLSLNANASFQDEQWFSAYNDAIGYGQIRQDAYWLFNGRLSWFSANEDYKLSVWGKNLTNEEYDTYAINLQGSFGYDYYSQGAPRTFGLDVSYRF